MTRHFSPTDQADTTQADTTHELLDELLSAPLAAEGETLRPVALRSVQAQRQIALRPFLLRNWIDRILYRVERSLMLILIVWLSYWLLDGYGRDWLYMTRQANLTVAVEAAAQLQSGDQAAVGVAEDTSVSMPEPSDSAAVALPYTTPDQHPRVADYLVPQHVSVPIERTDPRPRRLLLPTIQVDASVVEVFVQEGVWQVADYAVGYHHGSALPGTTGNTVMAGHAGLRGAVFRDLGKLQVDDMILVEAGDWQYGYRVRDIISVWPTQVEVMSPSTTPVLTLITCTAWDTKRLIVVADLVESRPLT